MNELVSIVVPVYNMGSSIEICVQSLLKQDYSNIEIILVDDGSVDDSLTKCLKIKDRDNRIKVFHTENRGSGPARNTGIQNAKGRYIYFPDADDELEPFAVTAMVNAMENGKYDMVVFGYKSLDAKGNMVLLKKYPEMDKDGEAIRQDYSDYMGSTRKYGIQGAPWNKFFDLEVIRRNGVEYPPLRRHQDEGFIGRYMCFAQRVHFIESVLYIHYVNDLRKEWDKYPVDYIDAVIGLNQTRKETILTWNENDKLTRKIIEHEYICNVVKALEMSYSPKMSLNGHQRRDWIKATVKKSKLDRCESPDTLGLYQRLVLNFIKKNRYSAAIMLICFKVQIEKSGLLLYLRR